jgi:hypothetical protein
MLLDIAGAKQSDTPELVNVATSATISCSLCSMVILTSRSKSGPTRTPKQVVDPQSGMAIKLQHNVNKEGITSASGMKALTLSFEGPMTLFGLK